MRGRTDDGRYVGVCDGIRVLSIGIVAWFHIWQQSWLWPSLPIPGTGRVLDLDFLVRSGYMWVDLMILLSGFCHALPWARLAPSDPDPAPGTFYRKRLARIVPSTYLSVLLFFALAFKSGLYADVGAALRDLLTHLSFTHVFSYETYYATPINAALWTISIEMHFYLLFPLIARAFRRRPFLTSGGMIAVALGFRAWIGAHVPVVDLYFNQLVAYLDTFALGMLAALVHVRLEAYGDRRIIRALGSVVALLALYGLLQLARGQSALGDVDAIRRGQMDRRLAMGLCGAGLLLGSAHGGPVIRRLLSNPLTRFLSGVSMQFYIWHQPFAVKLRESGLIFSPFDNPHYAGDAAWQQRFNLAVWLGALLLAAALTYGFERPIARLILGRDKKKRPPEGR